MTPMELQAAVMAFADTCNSRLSEIAAALDGIGTPQARLTSARMMVFAVSSNVEIAAGPYPGVALLDSVVLNTLRRMVWEQYWVPKVFGDKAKPVLPLFREIESEAWELAAKVMTKEQMDELMKTILLWREKNPHQVPVNWVRFNEFGELGLKPSMRKLTMPGGLFASVKQATMVAQDMKVAIDRAFYLISRMQLIINFQAKLAYLELIFQPEANGIINTTKHAMGLSERYAEIAENLPEDMGKQGSRLIKEVAAAVQVQSDATMHKLLSEVNAWQEHTIRNVMTSVSSERQAAIEQALNGILDQQKVLFSQMHQMVSMSGDAMDETLNHAFLLGLGLILAFFVALTLYRILVSRPLSRRENPRP